MSDLVETTSQSVFQSQKKPPPSPRPHSPIAEVALVDVADGMRSSRRSKDYIAHVLVVEAATILVYDADSASP